MWWWWCQWGDEGKGRWLTFTRACGRRRSLQGGTRRAYARRRRRKDRPSLIRRDLHDGKRCVIGNGVVLDPEVFIREVTNLKARAGCGMTGAACSASRCISSCLITNGSTSPRGKERREEDRHHRPRIGPTYEDKIAAAESG